MLKYTGNAVDTGLNTGVNIRIYGDGTAKEAWIDLSKIPFELNFKGFWPKNIFVTNIAGGILDSVTLQQSILHVLFQTAPPLYDFTSPVQPPHTSFNVQFVYGSDITT